MIYELPCEYFHTFFCRISCHTLDHLRGSSFQQWVSIHELIQPPPTQIPCWSSHPIKPPIYLVSFRQDHVSGHWISLNLHPNYSINQVRLYLKIKNRIRSRVIFSNVLPLYRYPPGNVSSGNVGKMVTDDHQFRPIIIFTYCSLELIVAVMISAPHQKVVS